MEEPSIPWTPVKALLNLAGKADIREQVNGVWIDRRGPHLIVWATTGKVLGAYRTEEPSTDGPDVFLPRHIVEAGSRDFAAMATIKRENDGRMSISCQGTTHYWQDKRLVPADWRRAVPARCTGIAQQFDARLLGSFLKARKALGHKDRDSAVRIGHNGGLEGAPRDSALIELWDVPEFIGALGTMRVDETGSVYLVSQPDWVREIGRVPVEETAGADLV